MRVSLTVAATIALIAAALIGVQWLGSDQAAGPAEREFVNSFPPSEVEPVSRTDGDDRNPADIDTAAVRPGSMQAYLLTASEDTRNHTIGLTLRDSGHACPEVRSSWGLDRQGSFWRASCGDALVYWVTVDESGRLAVEPAPYGDVDPVPMPRRVNPIPSNGERR